MTRALLVLAGVLLASSVHAQTVISVSPTNGILFTASADQNTTELDGSARLTRYEFRLTPAVPASCAAQPAVNLGKPAPDASNTISIKPLAAFGTLPANCIYTAVVAAIGPGGEGVSAPMNPFARVVGVPPAAGGKPAVLP